MSDLPWQTSSKDRLPRSFAHAVRRSQVEQSLRAAGAVLDHLSFGSPATDDPTTSVVFDVCWVGDGGSRIFDGPGRPGPRRLLMRWQAVPSAVRSHIAPEIVDRWLPEACAWAAAAPSRGNVWSATDHRWMLVQSHEGLTATVD